MKEILNGLINSEFGYMIANAFNANRFEYHAGKYAAYYDLLQGHRFTPGNGENINYIRGYNDGVKLANGFNLKGVLINECLYR